MGPILGALAGIGGTIADALFGASQARQNIQLQKDFAQKGIQWRVADAKAAGIHPLYALGANTTSFSPVPVGSNFGQAGQDIGRAVEAAGTPQTRAVGQLALERASLENDLLRAQIASERARLVGQVGPPVPDPRYPPDLFNPPVSPSHDQAVLMTPPAPMVPQPRSLAIGGAPWMVDPGWSSGGEFENVYGDDGPATWIFNALKAGNDLDLNTGLSRKLGWLMDPYRYFADQYPGEGAWYEKAWKNATTKGWWW